VKLKKARVVNMKWNEIREANPDSFVLLKALKYHIDGDKKYIDDMALVKIIDDPDEANHTLVRCKGDNFVYHTGKPEVVMKIIMNPVLRGVFKNRTSI
jgi:hypothetical protein